MYRHELTVFSAVTGIKYIIFLTRILVTINLTEHKVSLDML